MSEKIGGAKGTELDDEFVEMERVSLASFVNIKDFYSSILTKWLQ